MKATTRKQQSANSELIREAQRKARYGHKDWIAWFNAKGVCQIARKTRESVKQCLLDSGTQGQWLIIHASRGDESLGVWWMGINMLNQMKRGLK